MGSSGEKLDSWKEIADYLSRDVRTVQRWESSESLPVRRLFHLKRPSVYAYKGELDDWIRNQGDLLSDNADSIAVHSGNPLRTSRLLKTVGICLAVALLAAAGFLIAFDYLPDSIPIPTPVKVSPLTSYEGTEEHPTLSPLGDQVAYTWSGQDKGASDIYVEQIGLGSRLRLTETPQHEYSPAWSPDGSRIAFLRALPGGRSKIILIPALGGGERELAEVTTTDPVWGRQLAWAPDGEWLATTHRQAGSGFGLILIPVSTGAPIQLTEAPAGYMGDHSPAFSPEGRSLVFVRSLGERLSDLFVLHLNEDYHPRGEAAWQLTDSGSLVLAPVWLSDGRRVIYSTGTWPRLRLMEVDVSMPGDSRQIPFLGEGISSAAYSARANRLVFAQTSYEVNIWTLSLSDTVSGDEQQPHKFIVSSGLDWLPVFSPDGSQIVFSSDRSGNEELWLAANDGLDPAPLTRFMGTHCDSASWSPNGEEVVFHSCVNGGCNIFVKKAQTCLIGSTECEEDPCCLKQITFSDFDDFMPRWSRDGNWIYFASGRSGQIEVWKVSPDGGEPSQVTRGGGLYAIECTERNCLYYSRWDASGIWRLSLDSGSTEKIIESAEHRFDISDRGIFFISPEGEGADRFAVKFFDFESEVVTTLVSIEYRYACGLSVAPDRSSLLWSQFDHDAADLRVVDDFL
ncbi:MAG: PD40 domain-containing protein [Acidobacteriota bacterium]|nr:MAG: PD40 domain-containing protein [Acidobacteriota bacterium]